jgi:hypothetical protein
MGRLLGFFFGCSHYGVVEVPAKAWIGMARCVLRSGHRGEHEYPPGFVAVR